MRNLIRKYIAPVIFTAGLALGNPAYSSDIADPYQVSSELETKAEDSFYRNIQYVILFGLGIAVGYCAKSNYYDSLNKRRRK